MVITSDSGAWVFCLRGALHCMTIKKYITVYLMHWKSYRLSLLTTTACSSVAHDYERQVVGMTSRVLREGRRRPGGDGKGRR